MSLSLNNPLIIGDINKKTKEDISQIKQDIGDLSQLDTADKSSLVNALNEAIDSTLNGASRDLDNLSDIGNDKLRSLNAYANGGELLTDPDGLTFVEKYSHSTFDRSKFTVVGSPNITNDGIASGFSSSNYLTIPQFDVTKPFSVKIPFIFQTGSANWKDLFSIGNTYIDIGASVNIRMSIDLSTSGMKFTNKFISDLVIGSKYYIIFAWDGDTYTTKLYDDSNVLIDTVSYTSDEPIVAGDTHIGYRWNPWAGSIDLKQFSITVDGVEVFNGNKTGIDTIKPDDYTTTSTPPTITVDGIASGFSSNQAIKTSSLNFSNPFELEVQFELTTASGLNTVIGAGGNSQAGLQIATNGTSATYILLTDSSGTQIGEFYNSNKTGQTFQLRVKYTLKLSWIGTQYIIRFYDDNGTLINEKITDSSSALRSGTICIGGTIADQVYAWFKGNIDLNTFKFISNGNLVYQPCLNIPYTESKTGAKIVSSLYRDRVNDMADQFGFANYYTLQDEAKGNYTVVGSPTISSDFVASGFSSSNYLKTTYTSNATYDFEVLIGFRINSISSGMTIFAPMLAVYSNGRIVSNIGDGDKYGSYICTINTDYLAKIKLKNGYHSLNISTNNGATWTEVFNVENSGSYTFNNNFIGCTIYTTSPFTTGSIDLEEFKIYVDNKLAYEAVIEPNFTLPQVELYGLIGQRTLRDSYRNGINYWELYSNRDLEQGGSCTSGVEVTFARPFADTNYVLSVPYSAKSATAFTPTQTGDWIAKGKGIL